MIYYIIVDDEYVAHDIIKGYCDKLSNMKLQKNCYDALAAIEYLNSHSVDLIFLDLNMPVLKGFEFLRTLTHPPKVIVTTAYKEHALEGYELNIVDYLLKPFSFERFLKAVNKASINVEQNSSLKSKIQTSNFDDNSRTIFLKENKRNTQVEIDKVMFLEASGNYTIVYLENKTIKVREKISELLAEFETEDIIQVHKSFAVSIRHISSIIGNRILIKEHQIPIGKIFKSNVDVLLK